MPEQLSCPKLDELHQFLLGRLPADQTDRLQIHLAQCAPCLDTIESLKAEDTLVGAWRAQARAATASEDEQVAALIQKLSGLSRLPAATSAAVGDNPAPAPVEPQEVLAPPLGQDEIGRLGQYRVLKVLGVGGMGIVFAAEDPQLHRRVALKVMKPDLAARPADRQRFLREAQAMAALEHDHIVTIHQVGEDRGIPFLAMQLLKGVTLEHRLNQSGKAPADWAGEAPAEPQFREGEAPAEPRAEGDQVEAMLPLAEAIRITREIATGLAAAHAQGLTHRDIKPANIWLERSGRVKILDFGLARPEHDDTHLTKTGLIAGTPAYMSPEQAASQPVDHLSDLFSLGCVLYRLLTGQLPFAGPSTLAVLQALALQRPPPPHEVNADVPPPLSELTMRLLAKDPHGRPRSAEAVVQALTEIERKQAEDARRAEFNLQRAAAGRGKRFAVLAALVLLLVGPLAIWYAPTLYRIATDQGLLVIETNDNAVEVTVKQNGKLIKIVDRKTGREVTLKAGVYQLELSGDNRKQGLKLETDQFILTRGGRTIAHVTREQPAAPAAVPAIATPPGLPASPFVVLTNGEQREQKFATLAEAVVAAKSGDTIEVHGDGPVIRGLIFLNDKALTIRAAAGARPVLRLAPDPAQPQVPRLQTHASLTLEGLEIQLIGRAHDKPVAHWAVLSDESPLHLAHCRFVVHTQPKTSAIGAVRSPRCEVRYCQFALGRDCNGIEWLCPQAGQMLVEGNLIAGSANGLILHQRETDLQGVTLRLKGNTLAGAPLVWTLDAQPPAGEGRPALEVEASNNVIDRSVLEFHQDQGQYVSEARILAPVEAKSLLVKLVTWRERSNLYPEGVDLLVFGYPKPTDIRSDQSFTTLATLPAWQEFWGNKDTGSLQGHIRYQIGDLHSRIDDSPESLNPQDFRLEPGNAGTGAGPGGKDLGADVDQVGPGPAYERWKKTPDYQRWLKDIEQAKAEAARAQKAFVILARDARVEQKLATLADAVIAAHSGDTIEVRGDGPPIASPILIAGKALTIRAAPGAAPILLLKPATVQDAVPNLQTDSPLTLEGLTFHTIDQSVEKGPYYWTVIVDQAPLRVTNCRFAIASAWPYGVLMARGSARFELRNCQANVGTDRAFVDWRCTSGGQFVMDNNVVGGPIGHAVVIHDGDENLHDVRLTLSHNSTTLTPVLLLLFRPEPAATASEAAPAIRVDALENVFAGRRVIVSFGQEQAVADPGAKVLDTGAEAEALLRRLLAWRDERNVYSEGSDFLHLGNGGQRIEPTSARQNLTEWQRLWGTGDTGSLQGRIRFQGGDRPIKDANSSATFAPQDFRLAPGSIGKGAGEDGRDLGADVDLVGPGPAYERWKATPAYREWRKDAGQTP